MPPVKDDEWEHIEIADGEAGKQPKVRCLYCSRVFVSGAVRIRNHLIGGGDSPKAIHSTDYVQ